VATSIEVRSTPIDDAEPTSIEDPDATATDAVARMAK
jgi:hypothetical protein